MKKFKVIKAMPSFSIQLKAESEEKAVEKARQIEDKNWKLCESSERNAQYNAKEIPWSRRAYNDRLK